MVLSFLIIQTASIGDVILVTPVMESLHAAFPDAIIDLVVKKGNEDLFTGHPYLHRIITWDKSSGKYRNLFRMIGSIRSHTYQHVINIQRFGSTGLLTLLSGAKVTSGFTKNPFSLFFTHRSNHLISADGLTVHEVDRNLSLIGYLKIETVRKPALYPLQDDRKFIMPFRKALYLCIAPASLWFTKQFPAVKWIEFMDALHRSVTVYLIGSPQDRVICEQILHKTHHPHVISLAGKLTLLQTAALMEGARMNFVNDSAAQHLASSVNAPVSTIFCSTVPSFGFGPLSENSSVIETKEPLSCRPCGIHGYRECPEKHFLCAMSVQTNQLLERIPV